MDLMLKVVNEERLKDMYREANNERLARQAKTNRTDLLRDARTMIGQSLVKVGQKLLDERQR